MIREVVFARLVSSMTVFSTTTLRQLHRRRESVCPCSSYRILSRAGCFRACRTGVPGSRTPLHAPSAARAAFERSAPPACIHRVTSPHPGSARGRVVSNSFPAPSYEYRQTASLTCRSGRSHWPNGVTLNEHVGARRRRGAFREARKLSRTLHMAIRQGRGAAEGRAGSPHWSGVPVPLSSRSRYDTAYTT